MIDGFRILSGYNKSENAQKGWEIFMKETTKKFVEKILSIFIRPGCDE